LGNVLIPLVARHSIAPVWKLLVFFGFYVLAFGAMIGATTWRSNERDYQKPTQDDNIA
jgi:hypothetical protein